MLRCAEWCETFAQCAYLGCNDDSIKQDFYRFDENFVKKISNFNIYRQLLYLKRLNHSEDMDVFWNVGQK